MEDRALDQGTRDAARSRVLCALLLLANVVLSGCALTSGTTSAPSTPTPPQYLLYLIDSNIAFVRRLPDAQYSVVALDRRDGHRVWRHQLESPPGNRDSAVFLPGAQNGLIYVAYTTFNPKMVNGNQGELEALDPATGHTRWRHEVGSSIEGEPIISGGSIYLSANIVMTPGGQFLQSGLVQALDAQTGALRWQRAFSSTSSMPAVSGSLVMVVLGSQAGSELIALNTQDGTVRWDYVSDAKFSVRDVASDIWSTTPLVLGQLVYVRAPFWNGTTHVMLLALHVGDGSLAWQYDTGGSAATTPTLSQGGDTLCVSEYHLDATRTYFTGSVTGLSPSTGAVRWQVTVAFRASACVASGAAFYLSEQAQNPTGDLIALRSQDGHLLWLMPTATAPSGPLSGTGPFPPVIIGDLAVACLNGGPDSMNASLVAVGLDDGKPRWHAVAAGPSSIPLEINGGQIFMREGLVDSGNPELVAAYALQTGARLWTYTLGQLQQAT